MKLRLHKNNLMLKVVSLMIGSACWYTLSQWHPAAITLAIPVGICAPDQTTIDAPETVTVTLSGKRSTLSALDLENLALHIDSASLHAGKNRIAVCAQNLFLP
ncbi:MAG TPA: hypothetical protein VLG71_00490, partial [Candidatus Limnocylindria bacterium]|nr:hypothetical protein [Candidatus Limnocylindria bacterium]